MYIIQEIQTEAGVTALTPAYTETDINTAESIWHQKMAAAAISSVDIHTVLMYDEHGHVIKQGYYEHIDAPEPEPEPEPEA